MRAHSFASTLGTTVLVASALALGPLPIATGGSRRASTTPPIEAAARHQAIVDLSSADEDTRDAAVARLIAWKSPDAIEPAIAALTSPDVDVRFGAIRVLGACGGQKAAKSIVTTLQTDHDTRVRREASHALLEAAVPGIGVPAWLKAARADDDAGVRRATILDLGRSGDPDAFDGLVELYAEAIELEDSNTLKWTTNAMTLLCGARHDDNLEAWRHAAAQFRERIEAAAEAEHADEHESVANSDPPTEPDASAEPAEPQEPDPEPTPDPDPEHPTEPDSTTH